MAKAYVFLATGFEDIEALIPVDIWRRGGIEVTTVSVTGQNVVTSAHGVNIEADTCFEQCDLTDADLLFLAYMTNADMKLIEKLYDTLIKYHDSKTVEFKSENIN